MRMVRRGRRLAMLEVTRAQGAAHSVVSPLHPRGGAAHRVAVARRARDARATGPWTWALRAALGVLRIEWLH